MNGRKADFYWEFGTIFATAAEVQRRAHPARLGLRSKAFAMPVVCLPLRGWDQYVDILANQFVLRVAEHAHGLRIGLNDDAVRVDSQHGVGHGVKKARGQKCHDQAFGKSG